MYSAHVFVALLLVAGPVRGEAVHRRGDSQRSDGVTAVRIVPSLVPMMGFTPQERGFHNTLGGSRASPSVEPPPIDYVTGSFISRPDSILQWAL